MPKSKLSNKQIKASTQEYLDIAEIRDDVVVLKDGSLRAVLLVSSINFALKSEEEQNAIIEGYITFLNSIDFPIQICVQSRKLNIDKYLMDLAEKEKLQTNELLRTQISEYRDFISQLITLGDIMGKRFYVVVSYAYGKTPRKGFSGYLRTIFTPSKIIKLSEELFSKYQDRLASRVEKVISGLASIGLTAVQLNTQSLVELYYQCYNPQISYNQKLTPAELLNPSAIETE